MLIDDDPAIRKVLLRGLEQKDFEVIPVPSGEAGLKSARSGSFDAVVLDVDMPGMSGIEVCQALKRDPKTASIPILIITGNDKEGQEIICLELGADDYLLKPFDISLLTAHLHALLRRGTFLGTKPNVLEKGSISLDVGKKVVTLGGTKHPHLTPKEFDLIYHLVHNQGVPLKRDAIYQKVWGTPPVSPSVLRTVDVHIQRIRLKLGLERTRGIVAVSGRGYMWKDPKEASET